MNHSALRLEEEPWSSRALPPRPTRLVAVPAPRLCHSRAGGTRFRQECLEGPMGEVLQAAARSVDFLFLLGSVLGGFWALSRL